MDKNEYSKEINSYISDYIKFADTKGVSVLTMIGLISSGMFSLVDPFLKSTKKVNTASDVYLTIGIVFLVMSLILAIKTLIEVFRAFQPKINNSTNSLNSFPYLAKHDVVDDYVKEVSSLADSDIFVVCTQSLPSEFSHFLSLSTRLLSLVSITH